MIVTRTRQTRSTSRPARTFSYRTSPRQQRRTEGPGIITRGLSLIVLKESSSIHPRFILNSSLPTMLENDPQTNATRTRQSRRKMTPDQKIRNLRDAPQGEKPQSKVCGSEDKVRGA